METMEARIRRVTSLALARHREEMAKEFARQHTAMLTAAAGSDPYYIAVDKMLSAAEDCHAAHTALFADCVNPCREVWDLETVAMCRKSLGEKAADAYERAEAEMEDRALSRFHRDAFGK